MAAAYKLLLLFCLLLGLINQAYALDRDTPEKINILTMADIHFDPFINCKSTQPCELINRLRTSSIEQWPQIFEKYETRPSRVTEDTNFILLSSALAAAKQAAIDNQAKFVLVLGDTLGHEFRSKYKRYTGDRSPASSQAFIRKTLEFLTRQLSAAFPAADVYTIVGNNDSYQGDYYIVANNQFFADAGRIWSSLIKNPANRESMQKQFQLAGYYAVTLPNADSARLIVLNSNLFSYKRKGRNLDRYADQQLNWLHEQLQAAENNHQRVLIAMHIPEAVDIYATLRMRLFRVIALWKPEYSQRFQAELSKYSAEIAGVFVGHLHSDWYQVMTFGEGNEIPLVGVTSISPIFGNHPGFKICSYTIHPLHLNDFITYSYSLNGSRRWIDNKRQIW